MSGLSPGSYQLVVFARSTATSTFVSQAVPITVVPSATVFIDRPANAASVDLPVQVTGWALDTAATSGSGIDAIVAWAFPVSGAPATFLGEGTYGAMRPDIGTAFGDARFSASGFALTVSGVNLPAGAYNLVVFGRSTVTGSFTAASTVRVTVR